MPARFDSDSGFNQLIANAKRADKSKSIPSQPCGAKGLGLDLDYTMDDEIPAARIEVIESQEDGEWTDPSQWFVLPEIQPVSEQVGLTTPKQDYPPHQSPNQQCSQQKDWSDYSVKMLRTPAHPALQRRATVSKVSTQTKITTPTRTLSVSLPTLATASNNNNSRRRPSLQKPPTAEVTSKYDELAEAKLSLVKLQIEILKKDTERKVKNEESLMVRREKAEGEENKLKLELLQLEVEIKKQILKQEEVKTKKMESEKSN